MSQEGYRLFINICDLYLVLLQVMLFLVVWDIFSGRKGEKRKRCPQAYLQQPMYSCVYAPAFRDGRGMRYRLLLYWGTAVSDIRAVWKRLFSRCCYFTISTG